MGRSNRQTADYFPHYVGEKSRTKFILEKNWGNDGYAFWFKLLELLCAADGQYYDCWDKMGWEYLLAVTGVTAETAEAILNTLASMGKVDKELWESCRVIWVQSLLENLRQLYSKRTAAPTKPSVDNFPGRMAESSAQEPAAATASARARSRRGPLSGLCQPGHSPKSLAQPRRSISYSIFCGRK